jgi:hypothetical protein
MDDVVKELTTAALDFLVPLRMGDGYSHEKFRALCQAIRDVNGRYTDSLVLPKDCVIILVDLAPGIESVKPLYDEQVGTLLLDASITIMELIGEGLVVPTRTDDEYRWPGLQDT